MEVLLGIVGSDFVLTASDTLTARSIVVMKRGEDKSRALNKTSLLLFTGEPGDTVQFAEFIQKNAQLYSMRHSVDLSPFALSSMLRRELAEALRSRNPYSINTLVAGYDTFKNTPELYWLDYLSSCTAMKFAAHGHASYFCMSTMDRYWKENMNLDQAIFVLKMCIKELKTRYIVNMTDFKVKVIDKNGIKEINLSDY